MILGAAICVDDNRVWLDCCRAACGTGLWAFLPQPDCVSKAVATDDDASRKRRCYVPGK